MKEIFTCSPLFAVTVNATGWNEAENRTAQKCGINNSTYCLYLVSGLKAENGLQYDPDSDFDIYISLEHTLILYHQQPQLYVLAMTEDSPIP